MPLNIKGNIIETTDITNRGVFKKRVNTEGIITRLDGASKDSYVGTGTSWIDLSGAGNGATISEFSFSTNNGGDFVNSTQRSGAVGMTYSLTNFSKLVGTIEIWSKPSSWFGGNGLFVNRNDDTANANDWLWLGVWDNGNVLYFRLGDAGGCCGNDNAITSWSTIHSLNTWGLYTVTWSSNLESRIYFNGTLRQTKLITAIPNTNPSTNGRIGLGPNTTNSMWLGEIATFTHYNKVLNPFEVAENFQATRGRFGI